MHAVSLLILLLVLTQGCASLGVYRESPRVSLVSITPQEMTLLEQRYGLQLRILNPNDTSIPVEGLSYSLEINGREFAYGVSRQSVSVPAYGEALLDVTVVSNFLNILRQLQQMDKETNRDLEYRLAGKISMANRISKLPFDYSGKLTFRAEEPAAP
jgi:LEA14-like dessication related protein